MLIIQFTGLSGSGKSTLSRIMHSKLSEDGLEVFVIDGDVYRKTVCNDLGYSKADRVENIRRLGEIASNYGRGVVIIAAINPYNEARAELKEKYNAKLIWLKCDLSVLIERDTKGLYKRALLPDADPLKIGNLSGLNDEFEIPVDV